MLSLFDHAFRPFVLPCFSEPEKTSLFFLATFALRGYEMTLN